MLRRKLPVLCFVAALVFGIAGFVKAFPYEDGALYATGDFPQAMATGDFDEDGFEDVVSANLNSDDLSVLLGDGCGTFESAVSYATGNGPAFLTVGDFDGDVNEDLAVANFVDNTVSILLGNGNGTFDAAVAYATGNVGFSGMILVEDFDGDGNADLALTAISDAEISILMGNGDGTFDSAVGYATESSPVGLVAGLFNGDASLDLIATNVFGGLSGDGDFSFFAGNGDGTFDAAVGIADSFLFHPEGLAAGDLNGDLKLDLLIGDEGIDPPGALHILLGNGDGTFGAVVTYDGVGVTEIVLDDIDGDGETDILTNEAAYGVYLGNGDGTVQDGYFFGAGGGEAFTSADFDEDGETDLISGARDRDFARVAIGNGDGTFQAPSYYRQTSQSDTIIIADFDEDGTDDLAMPSRFDDAISVRLAVGDGTYGNAIDFTNYASGPEPVDLFVGDLDGDDNLDLAVPNYGAAGSDTISILLGNGDGTFDASIEYGDAVPEPFPVAIDGGDFDGDDDIDLVVSHANDPGAFTYFENDGTGSFSASTFATNAFPKDVFVAELNGDDFLDFALAHEFDGLDSISLYFGNGDGTFAAPSFAGGDVTDADSPRSIAGSDFDADGDMDLAVADEVHSTVAVYLNDGNGIFTQEAEYGDPYTSPFTDTPHEIAAGDVNGDSNIDLVTAESIGNNGFAVFLGNGDGSFVVGSVDGPTELMTAVTIADVDGAGNLDLVMFNDDWEAIYTYVSSGIPVGCGGDRSGSGSQGAKVTVTDPNGGETLVSGSSFPITWTTEGHADPVDIAYSTDGGVTWTPIAQGTPNSGTWSWIVPNIASDEARIRVETTNAFFGFASDVSDEPFAIRDGQPILVETLVNGLRALVNLTTGCRSFPEGVFLPNPTTLRPETLGEVCPGDYITSPSFKTIYYVTTAFIRRPFYDVLTFLTHQPSFLGVKIVTDATLLTLRLDGLMLPKPGSVLIKFQGSKGVYALFQNPRDSLKPIARLLETESAAKANFGEEWTAFILEFPPTLFDLFDYGLPIEGKEELDASRLLRRRDLEAVTNPYTFAVIRKIMETLHVRAQK